MQYRSLLNLLPIILLLTACSRQGAWKVTEQQDGIFIGQGKDSVLFYQRIPDPADGEYARAHYIHPLYGLNNTVLTENKPDDHPHHHGIFWAWHQNYVGDKSVGDAWALEDFSWEVIRAEVDQYRDSCVLQTEVFWKSPLWLDAEGGQKPFAKEKAIVSIRSTTDSYRIIDFRIEIEALVDSFQIGGSNDAKGYSGFSWRIRLPEPITFAGVKGPVTPQTLALDAGPWMNITGDLDGQTGEEGVLVIGHPDNPGHPQPWILRSKRSMQNAAFPGREKYMIPRTEPLLLRYRMVVYDGTLSRGQQEEVLGSWY